MAETALTNTATSITRPAGWRGIAADWSSDQRAFKNVSWGKAMMWIFLLSDTFIFSCFLLSYMTTRMTTTVPWPNPSEVFALTIGDKKIPLILIAIMTFILISSSGTMGGIFLVRIGRKVWRGDFDVERRGFFTSRKGYYEIVEITGLYWHFVDLVWVFIFAFFYLW